MTLLREIQLRRSRRSFSAGDISHGVLEELAEAARISPSCFNKQPARYVFVTGDSLKDLHAALSEGNAWAKEAPVLLAVISKPKFGCRSREREYFMFDSGLSLENMILQAVHLGLFAHPMLGFDEEMAREVLGVPGDHRIIALVAIGYPDPEENVPDKERKSLDEMFYLQKWGVGLKQRDPP